MAPCSFSTNVGLCELDTFCYVYQKIGVEVDGAHYTAHTICVSTSLLLFILTLFKQMNYPLFGNFGESR